MPPLPVPNALDFSAAQRWPSRAAAHVLGAGLLLAVVAALPVAPTDLDRHQLPKETIVHLATWVAVLLARPLPPRGLRPAALWSLAILLGLTVASGLAASNGWLALRAGSLLLTGMAAFVTARQLAARGHGAILLAWCAIAGVVGACTGLAQAYGLESPLFAITRLPGGTFGNRNFMAHFAAITLPILILTGLSAPKPTHRVAAALGGAILVAAIVLSRSRAAWLGVIAGMVILGLVCLRGWRLRALPAIGVRAVTLGAAMIVGATVAVIVPNRLTWRSASPYTDTLAGIANSEDGSGRGRLLQYRNTLRLASRHPSLGVGPGNWSVHYAEVATPNDPTWVWGDAVPINPWPSSDWMALVSELGIAALLAALLFGTALAWRAWQATLAGGDRLLAGATLLMLLVVTFIEGNLDAVLLLPAPLLFVAMSAGALLQRCDESEILELPGAVNPPRITQLLPLALGLVTLRSTLETTAYVVAGSGRSTGRLIWAARIDPGSYPIRIALAQRRSCTESRNDVLAVVRMAPTWPATREAAKRCGVRAR